MTCDSNSTCGCRAPRRSVSGWAGVVLGGLALVVASTGTAVAAAGGYVMLGRTNTSSVTTTLSDASGTPLRLNSSAAKPPLAVNSSRKVKMLNADLLDGLDSTAFALKSQVVPDNYFEAQGAPDALPTLRSDPTLVVQKDLPAGQYLVTITGSFVNQTNAATSTCGVRMGDIDLVEIGMPYPRWQSVSQSTPQMDGRLWMSGPMKLTDPTTTLSVWCRTSDSGNTVLAGPVTLQALQVASVNATRFG